MEDHSAGRPASSYAVFQTYQSTKSLVTDSLEYSEMRTPNTDDAMEVYFESDGVIRRKSSLVPTESHDHRNDRPPKPTNCYVHDLIEEHRDRGIQNSQHRQPDSATQADKDAEGQELSNGGGAHRTDSRFLTKKQLSDMAFGIRELSKTLSRVKLRLKVRSIFVLTKAHDDSLIGRTRDLAEWLLTKEECYTVWVESTMKSHANFDAQRLLKKDDSKLVGKLKFWDNELCKKKPLSFDIVLALGGDGTVLYASWLFQRIVPPVLAFSLGSLGFLTKFNFDHYQDTFSKAVSEGVTVSLRLRFEGTVMRRQEREGCDGTEAPRDLIEELIGEEAEDHFTHRPDGTYNVMNEVVLDRGPNATMSTLEIFGDNEHFTTVQADGVCIATPTGSTAYNLAAGGSLCHPENPVILITAICAHTLSFRPIILPDTVVLRVGVPFDARTSSWASFDGRERVELHPGDYVTISASRYPFPSVLPLSRHKEDWIDSISRTLNWNSRQRQKQFDHE